MLHIVDVACSLRPARNSPLHWIILILVDNIVEFVDNIDDSDDVPSQSLQKDKIDIG